MCLTFKCHLKVTTIAFASAEVDVIVHLTNTSIIIIIIIIIICVLHVYNTLDLQCFDDIGWASGRVSGL